VMKTNYSKILADAAARSIRYRNGVESRRVVPSREAIEALAALDGSMPDGPVEAADVLAQLDDIGSPATVAMAGGRYFGFVIGSSLPATLAANWLAGAWDQNSALSVMSPVATRVESIALRWLLEILHLPLTCAGAF